MTKEIYFCIDNQSYLEYSCHKPKLKQQPVFNPTNYALTQQGIDEGVCLIVTTSLAHLSFDLMNKGYNIYLCYKDKKVKIEDGMRLQEGSRMTRPICYEDADILDCFQWGYFNGLLGIENQ